MAYNSNKLSVAVYPICVEYLAEINGQEQIQKGAIVFISSDKKHDYQQVHQFEKRMFQIIRRKCPGAVQNWVRFSDGCASQFRSRKVNADLLKSQKDFDLNQVSFQYFEANEGKNISDSIGSIVKCAFQRGIMKRNEGITTAAEIVKIIRDEVKESTEKFTFFIIEKFEAFSRNDAEGGYPLAGIL